jgi:hypothetical protein
VPRQRRLPSARVSEQKDKRGFPDGGQHTQRSTVVSMRTVPYRSRTTQQQVLLAADPNHDVLVVHPQSALDTMITTYHAH